MALGAGVLLVGGCAGVVQTLRDLTPPRVSLREVKLVERPAPHDLEAALCPRALRRAGAPPDIARDTCVGVMGPPPAAGLAVSFELELEVENQNYVNLPLSDVLLGLRLYPDGLQPWAGMSCLVLCAPHDPHCWAKEPARTCDGVRREVPSEDAYHGALADLVVGQGVLPAGAGAPRRDSPWLPARSTVRVRARFGLVPGAVVEVLTEMASHRAEEIRRGEAVPLVIPYEIDGAVYVPRGDGPRLGQAFGPVRGTWAFSETRAAQGGGAAQAREARR